MARIASTRALFDDGADHRIALDTTELSPSACASLIADGLRRRG